jgi:hypothetical protein
MDDLVRHPFFVPLIVLFINQVDIKPPSMIYPQFMDKVTNNLFVQGAVINFKPGSEMRTIEGRYYKTDPVGNVLKDANGKKLEVPFRVTLQISDRELEKVLATGRFQMR